VQVYSEGDAYPLGDMIRTMFQPIATGPDQPWAILAFECLSRGPIGTPLESAGQLFTRTRLLGMESDIDRACLWRALHTANLHGVQHQLFMNVHAATLRAQPGFVNFLISTADRCVIDLGRIVIEVIEHDRERYRDETAAVLQDLSARGIAIALDDFGANAGDLDLLRCWRPDYVKLDGNLLRWARRSSAARQVLECAVTDAALRGSEVIAEGMEEDADLQLAESLGIRHVQGYAIARPLAPRAAARAHHARITKASLGALTS
jgi:EAL domain-containing protein (putative c-di-GMP-specific phosphodiesterase class I)